MRSLYNFLEKLYAFVFIAVCFGVITLGSYWMYFQPSDILTNVDAVVTVNNGNNIVEAGKTMILNRFFCINNTSYVGEVTRTFTNHMVYQLPNTTTYTLNAVKGCNEKKYLVDIPASLLTGEYEYKVHITYKVNPLKTVNYSLTPVFIRVVNPTWDRVQQLIKEEKKL